MMGLSATLPVSLCGRYQGCVSAGGVGSRRVPAGHLPTSTGWIRGTPSYRQPRYPPGHRPL